MTSSRTVALPRLILIADRFIQLDRAEQAARAVSAGVRWVHLRDHAVGETDFKEAAESFVRRLQDEAEAIRLSINGRLGEARRLGLAFHTGARGPSVEAARADLGEDALIGFSAHSLEEGRRAAEAGAGYLFLSPIFPSSSKPGHLGVGLTMLSNFCAAFPEVPVFALGGVTPERVASCRQAGAHGIAVLSGIMDAADPSPAVTAYLNVVNYPKSKIQNPK